MEWATNCESKLSEDLNGCDTLASVIEVNQDI